MAVAQIQPTAAFGEASSTTDSNVTVTTADGTGARDVTVPTASAQDVTANSNIITTPYRRTASASNPPPPRLSSPPPAQQPSNFQWGPLEGVDFCAMISNAYEEVIHWRRNVFLIPSGSAGKAFVSEIARLFQAYADSSSLESIAMKAITVLQVLLLQKPSRSSKSSDHATHLKRRLDLWQKGDIESLSQEGRCIQNRLHKTSGSAGDDEAISRIFCKLMMEGKIQGALRYLSRHTTGGVLKLDDLIPVRTTDGDTCLRSTYDILQEKYPVGKPPAPDYLSNSSPDPSAFNTILFDNLNADTIHQAALHTHGSAVPAGLDAHAWRRMCSSFKGASRILLLDLRILAGGLPPLRCRG